jgi:hypothetical protein
VSRLGFALAMAAVVAAAAWAYNVNYQTKMALARVDGLRAEIAAEREAVEVLRVEWAYLNAPDRLTRLVAMNNDRLDLVPMGPQHFDEVAAVPFPPSPAPELPGKAPGEPTGAPDPEAPDSPALVEATPEPPLEISGRTASAGAAIPLPTPRPASWRSR